MNAILLIASITIEEAKAKHHAYIACLKHHSVRYCNVKHQVKS